MIKVYVLAAYTAWLYFKVIYSHPHPKINVTRNAPQCLLSVTVIIILLTDCLQGTRIFF